jgi:WD40 repeat protein
MSVGTLLLLLQASYSTGSPCYANKPELIVRTGHSGPVCSIAFSPDGQTLASGGVDGTIKLWDVSSGQEVGGFPADTFEVSSVCWTPDGKTLASGGSSTSVNLWNVSEGRAARTLESPGVVRYVAFSPDGRTLATVGGRVPRLWDLKSGRCLPNLPNPTSEESSWVFENSLTSIAWSPDGKILATDTEGDLVKLWDTVSGKKLPVLEAPGLGPIYALAFTPDCKTLAVGSGDGGIRFWNLAAGKLLRTLPAHDGRVYGLAFSPDGKLLASGGRDKVIKFWDASSAKEVRTLPLTAGSLRSLSFSPDGRTLAGTDNAVIRLWEVESGREIETLDAHSNPIASIVCSPDGSNIVSAENDYAVRMWSLGSYPQIRRLTTSNAANEFVAFSADGKTLAVQGTNSPAPPAVPSISIQLLDPVSGKEMKRLAVYSAPKRSQITSQTIHVESPQPGGEFAFTSGYATFGPPSLSPDGKLLSASCRRPRNILSFPPGPPSPRIKTPAARGRGEWDTILRLYDVASLTPLHTHVDCKSYSWSPDHKTLALSTADGTIELWDVLSWMKSGSLVPYSAVITESGRRRNQRSIVNSMTWSADGKMLSTEFNTVIRLWDAESLKLLKSFNGMHGRSAMWGSQVHSLNGKTLILSEAETTRLSFSPDGQSLVVADQRCCGDNTVALWDVSSGKIRLRLKGHTNGVTSALFTPDGKTIVSASRDRTIRLWNSASGAELARLYSFGSEDWVVVAPDGHFDASPGAIRMLYWRNGNQIVESNEFEKRFYVPGLLRKTIVGFYLQEFKEASIQSFCNVIGKRN